MKSSFILPLLLLVVLPLAGLAWLGVRTLEGERARVRESLGRVMEQRLGEMNGSIAQAIGAVERELIQALSISDESTSTLRELPRQQRMIQQLTLLTPDGRRIHPPMVPSQQSNEEADFLLRSAAWWQSGVKLGTNATEVESSPDQGWQSWYHGTGPRYLFWHRLHSGNLLAAEVPTAALLAEVIAKLPASQAADTSSFKLSDPQGMSWYEWGAFTGPGLTRRGNLPPPLGAWGMSISIPDATAQHEGDWSLQLVGALSVAAVLMGLIAFYLYRESAREMRLAGQRVSFVNQVSHELKTPLTNISLYAELAAQRLPEAAEPARECLQVVTSECARLGRLIGNVLTFSKHQRGSLQPRMQDFDLGELLNSIIEQFRPALDARHLQLRTEFLISRLQRSDPDMLGQIVGNLLSNVEKYAGQDSEVLLRAEQMETSLQLLVRDHGPGIPAALQHRIFEAFYRVSDNANDGHAGTGLGLSIARDLARSLGGDLQCQSPATGPGALFIFTLPNA